MCELDYPTGTPRHLARGVLVSLFIFSLLRVSVPLSAVENYEGLRGNQRKLLAKHSTVIAIEQR